MPDKVPSRTTPTKADKLILWLLGAGVMAGLAFGLVVATMVQMGSIHGPLEAGQIQALSTAIESFKVDNAVVPRTVHTDSLDPLHHHFNPRSLQYREAGLDLYRALSGDFDLDRLKDHDAKSYFNL